MLAIHLTRQSDLIPEDVLNTRIIVVGAGAIGSFTVLTLAKMGFNNITVWDDDIIDPENMNCQFYKLSDIGSKKVDALREQVIEFTGITINTKDERVTRDTRISGDIIISAVDSMVAREIILGAFAGHHLLDARMGAEYIAQYYVDMLNSSSVETYRASLYSDEEAVQERCTAKSTMYTVGNIAGLLGKAVKDIVTEGKPISSLDWNVKDNSAVWFTDGKKGTM
jgi:saccharopine dehydrogenase-like NADP-dependent oxidoreductase